MQLPWSPLFTIERSGHPEITVSGMVAVWEGDGKQLLAVGDQQAIIWTRSLLKPWQILSLLPELKKAYHLKPHHLAMMLASHSGEPWQLDYLKEILMLGGLDEMELKCPAFYPMAANLKAQLESSGEPAKPIYHPCSGKHAAYLLAMKSKGLPTGEYLKPDANQFQLLKDLLAWLLDTDTSGLKETTDGCLLPNFGFTAGQIARMYGALARELPADRLAAAPDNLRRLLASWSELREVMIQYPKLIGGTNRLDSKIMAGELTRDPGLHVVAKEGADGLLAVGVSPGSGFKDGLGILVKLAAGYNPIYLETVILSIFEQLGLREAQETGSTRMQHLATKFHFTLPRHQTA